MTIMQLLMLGASAFFAFKIYEHIQTLKDPADKPESDSAAKPPQRTADAFSTFDSSSLMEKADEARGAGNLDRALAIYSEANIKEPKNAETLFKMAYTLLLQERDDEALEYLQESILYDNKNPFAYQEMVKIYAKRGDDEKAQEYREIAKKIDENF